LANPPDDKPLPDSGNRMGRDPRFAIFPTSPGSFASGQPIFVSTARLKHSRDLREHRESSS